VARIVEALVDPRLVLFDVAAQSKEDVIRSLGERLFETGRVTDLDGYVAAVLEREAQSSTAVGLSVATPHAKTDHAAQASLGFARLAEEIVWDDEESVRLVFIIAVPSKDAGDRHLQILAKLFRKFVDEEFLATISKATDPGDIVALIEDIT
jgi:fructose-specific phosphotransferase system IIA component